ncbi:MAG: hypothetical protein SOT02_05630, partial [Elusimicrobiaceae bacterium]|nr:hypothetical protein [Elusimicrobiaceae bacterium]
LPEYSKAVERSRMAEAVTLMDSVVKAQRRKFMQTNRYAENFKGLDVSPKGAKGENYYTKGDPRTGAGGKNGFLISLSGIMVFATRVFDGNWASDSLQYQYYLYRYYQSDNVSCYGNNQAGRELCADFCGIDTPVESCCNDGRSTSSGCPRPTDN